MTRCIPTLVIVFVTALLSNPSLNAQGLPMTDQLGGGSGVYGTGSSGGYTSSTRATPRTSYTPRTTNTNRGFQPQTRGMSPQQAQEMANAIAALGPAMQQARQNLQQIRARNGGTLYPQQNRSGGLFGNRQPSNLNQPTRQRYSDVFGYQNAQQVRRNLLRNGYRNVRVQNHPHNAWRQQQGLTPVYGIYHNR